MHRSTIVGRLALNTNRHIMNDVLWSGDEFRFFILKLRGPLDADVDDGERQRFIRQARLRIAPEVQRRILANIGALTDLDGIACAALDILDDLLWTKRRTWITVATDPWGVLTDVVTRRVQKSYRATFREDDARALDGIAEVSSRAELGAGGGSASDPRGP